MTCDECGQPMFRDANGVSYHIKQDDEDNVDTTSRKVDHDQDGDHVAYTEDPTVADLQAWLKSYKDPQNTLVFLDETAANDGAPGDFVNLKEFFG